LIAINLQEASLSMSFALPKAVSYDNFRH